LPGGGLSLYLPAFRAPPGCEVSGRLNSTSATTLAAEALIGPFGAEGPIIMTGGALGSLFAQLFHLSNAERKTLLVAGAAAGMSATFGTPIAAILLAAD
jgi:H+/Cl- antiporter ClcA